MYSYKINNSYTVYVVTGSDGYREDDFYYRRQSSKPEWKKGAKVFHSFYGNGIINEITNNLVLIHFKNTKSNPNFRDVLVQFNYHKNPSEISNLKLSH